MSIFYLGWEAEQAVAQVLCFAVIVAICDYLMECLTARQISIDVCTTIEQVYGEFIYKAAGKLLIVAIEV